MKNEIIFSPFTSSVRLFRRRMLFVAMLDSVAFVSVLSVPPLEDDNSQFVVLHGADLMVERGKIKYPLDTLGS